MNNHQIEYVVAKKSEGSYKAKRIAMILFYIFYAVAVLVLCIGVMKNVFIVAVVPITLYVIFLLTWRFVNIEYKYETRGSKLVFSEIIGGRKEVEKATFEIAKVSAVVPMNKPEELAKYTVQNTYDARPSVSASECYALFANDQNDVSSVFYFQAPERVLKSVKYYLSVDVRADLEEMMDEE